MRYRGGMSQLMNLTVYNPGALSDDDFLRGFVARQGVAHNLISALKGVTPDSLSKHHLVVGQRGMGKTSMLRRLALAATQDVMLSKVLIPLSFREEQYNVHSLHVFWVNCLDALGDWYDRQGQHGKADQLDKDVAALSGQPGEARALFDRWIDSEGRRPLLLLDNIDFIFDGLKKEPGSLEEFVPKPGGIVIVGGAAAQVDEVSGENAQLKAHFQITQLNRLSKEELIACLRGLALARGVEGEKVLLLVSKDSARIKTLHDLTGGNPRTLTLLYMLLEADSDGDVFSDLERLLDQVTVLYKARVEDLPPQARVVLDAVALTWNPVVAGEVAIVTKLPIQNVSSQLDRLQKDGVVEKVSVSKTTKGAYQISERFFNIWYLMRHGQRRQRSRLRWLTVFLRSFYTDAQLLERAKSMVSGDGDLGAEAGHYMLALCDAIEDEGWRAVLRSQARSEFERVALSLGRRLEDIVDPSDVPLPRTVNDWNNYGFLLRQHLKRSREAEQAYLSALALDKHSWEAWFNLGSVRLADLADATGAVKAYESAIKENPRHVPSHFLLGNAWQELGSIESAIAAYKGCLKVNPKFYLAEIAIGDLLSEEGLLLEAEAHFLRAGRLAPKTDTEALHASAFFTNYILEDFQRSYNLYRRLLDINRKDVIARANAAVLGAFVNDEKLVALDDVLSERVHTPQGRALMKAIVALKERNVATAIALTGDAFTDDSGLVFETYRGFVLLFLREAQRSNLGEIVLRIMDETGASDRNWPLRAGYEAYLFGKERLLDVNPEVRTAASKILSLLSAPQTYREEMQSK